MEKEQADALAKANLRWMHYLDKSIGMIVIDLLVIPIPVATATKRDIINNYLKGNRYQPSDNLQPYAVFVLFGPLNLLSRIDPEQGLVLLDDFLNHNTPGQVSD